MIRSGMAYRFIPVEDCPDLRDYAGKIVVALRLDDCPHAAACSWIVRCPSGREIKVFSDELHPVAPNSLKFHNGNWQSFQPEDRVKCLVCWDASGYLDPNTTYVVKSVNRGLLELYDVPGCWHPRRFRKD